MPAITTTVITYNEEANIRRCLESVKSFSDEIVVVDSHSTDRTPEIARDCGARLIDRDWPGYGEQRQFALEQASNDWVLSLDADEVVTPGLAEEIRALDFRYDGYQVARPVWYMGRWIKHGVWYPGYVTRLVHKDRARVTGESVHEALIVDGRTGRLRNDLLHYSYRDIDHHLDTINSFTTISADEMAARGKRAGVARLALYPFMEFVRCYVWKRGFLDGYPGFQVALLHGYYAFLKYSKLREASFPPPESDDAVDTSGETDKV